MLVVGVECVLEGGLVHVVFDSALVVVVVVVGVVAVVVVALPLAVRAGFSQNLYYNFAF